MRSERKLIWQNYQNSSVIKLITKIFIYWAQGMLTTATKDKIYCSSPSPWYSAILLSATIISSTVWSRETDLLLRVDVGFVGIFNRWSLLYSLDSVSSAETINASSSVEMEVGKHIRENLWFVKYRMPP